MVYTISGKSFSVSYKELKNHYIRFVEMTDTEFLNNIPNALHLACMIGYFKELGLDATIGDLGIVHELIHLLDKTETTPLCEIREQFKSVLMLV